MAEIVVTGILNKKVCWIQTGSQMGIKILICQNIKHEYTYNKKYTYINKPVFVILSSLIMYAKLGRISGCIPNLLG